MAEPVRHRQTKEAATDMFSLQPPRHIPTLPSYGELTRHAAIPFSEIKLDRSFVCNCDHDPQNASLCGTIIDFAHRYHAKAVADGVETPGELKALRHVGCDYGQGYALGPAMSKSDFVTLLQLRSHKVVARCVA
jgi:EAL domain-containing protein (putative c-di-GMP-specific phosphodiesterase class I)